MLQSTIWNKVLYGTKYYMLQSTKCYTVLNITKYYMCIPLNSMFLHGNSLWITCVIFSSKKVETLRLCSTSRNFLYRCLTKVYHDCNKLLWLQIPALMRSVWQKENMGGMIHFSKLIFLDRVHPKWGESYPLFSLILKGLGILRICSHIGGRWVYSLLFSLNFGGAIHFPTKIALFGGKQ